jgi:Transcriptional regulator
MDYRDLSYVLALAQHGTMVQAAKSLYISQPSLSKYLNNLEHEIGVPLFTRVGKRYQLTYAGKRYAETAVKMLDLKKQLDSELAEIARADQGMLRVGFPLVRGSYILPSVLPVFHQRYPNVHVQVNEVDSVLLQKMLLEGNIDLAIFSRAEADPRLRYEELGHEEYVLILPPGHPAEQKATHSGRRKYPWIDIRELANEDFIMFEGSQRSKTIIEGLLKQYDIDPNVVLTLRNISTVVQTVNGGLGFSFVLESHVLNQPRSRRPRCFSIGEKGIFMNCVAASRANAYRPQYELDFIQLVRERYQDMLHL